MSSPGGDFNCGNGGASGNWSDGYSTTKLWSEGVSDAKGSSNWNDIDWGKTSTPEQSASGHSSPVERCSRVADPPLGNLGVEHQWLRTDSKEAGMGPANGEVPGVESGRISDNLPYTDTRINDHTGEGDKPGSHCEPVNNVDAECVNEELEIGKELGAWSAWNNCNTFANEVLENCEANMSGPDGQPSRADAPSDGASAADGACNPSNQSCPPEQPSQGDANACDSNTQSCPPAETGQSAAGAGDANNQSYAPNAVSQGDGGSCDPSNSSCPTESSSQPGNVGGSMQGADSSGIHDGNEVGGDSTCYTDTGELGSVTECGPSSVESSASSGFESSASDMSSGGFSASDSSSNSSSSTDSSASSSASDMSSGSSSASDSSSSSDSSHSSASSSSMSDSSSSSASTNASSF